MSIVWALIIFSLIILFHEFGHFLMAKLNGIEVLEFSLGMGPCILSKKWRGTKYCLKILPFGGSCMMLGEDAADDQEGAFGSKSVWARMTVIAGGPVFNFILALFLALIVVGNYGYDPALIRSVSAGSPAEEAGLMEGDVVTRMNGKTIHLGREVSNYMMFYKGGSIDLTYKRDGETHTVQITPDLTDDGRYLMGVGVNTAYEKGGVLTTLRYGVYEVRYWIDVTIESIKMLVRGEAGLKDLSGPVGVVDMIGDAYTVNAPYGLEAIAFGMLNMAILLSATLGVMNLLPLPALDGGRLLFLLLEAVRGKRINPEREAMVHFVGLMALMLLMVVVMYNDVARIFFA